MPEYHALRLTLALLQLSLCVRIVRRKAGYLLVFGLCMYADAIGNGIPADLYRGGWWRRVWLPLAIVRLALAICTSIDLFAFLRSRTVREERRLLLAWSALIGVMIMSAGWLWIPKDWFQAVITGRQYILMGLCAGTSAAWVYVRWLRPISAPPVDSKNLLIMQGVTTLPWSKTGDLGAAGRQSHIQLSETIGQLRMWLIWLVLLFLMSSTGAAGLTWVIFEWKGGQHVWRVINDACLVAQCGLIVGWLISLRRPRDVAPCLSMCLQSNSIARLHLPETEQTLL